MEKFRQVTRTPVPVDVAERMQPQVITEERFAAMQDVMYPMSWAQTGYYEFYRMPEEYGYGLYLSFIQIQTESGVKSFELLTTRMTRASAIYKYINENILIEGQQ